MTATPIGGLDRTPPTSSSVRANSKGGNKATTQSGAIPSSKQQQSDSSSSNGQGPPDSIAVDPDLEQELEHFRREWIQESQFKKQQQQQQQTAQITLPRSESVQSQQNKQPQGQLGRDQDEAADNDDELDDSIDRSSVTVNVATSPTLNATTTVINPTSPPRDHYRNLSASPPTSPTNRFSQLSLNNVPIESGASTSIESSLKLANKTSTYTKKPKTAIELYDAAVISEREGRLNDALSNYRAAFKIDPDVDRTYHRLSQRIIENTNNNQSSSSAASNQITSLDSATPNEFQFERTIQLTPDYSADREHRTAQNVEDQTGSAPSSRHDLHPSSTAFLYDSLAKSFAVNRFDPIKKEHVVADDAQSLTEPEIDRAVDELGFYPLDPELSMPIGSLPREVLLLVLRHLVLSSVLPPPRPHPSTLNGDAESNKPGGNRRKGGPRKLTLAEQTLVLESSFEVPWEHTQRPWKIDVEALERFARTSRAARMLTLDSSLWRSLCQTVYVPPYQTHQPLPLIVRQHGNDYRRCFIEHPRLRFDGTYISVVTYLRRGDTASSWYSPTHLITFYRYLRFYPTGLVLSLLSVDPPNQVVRNLNPSLRVKGLTFGKWRLRPSSPTTVSKSMTGHGETEKNSNGKDPPHQAPQESIIDLWDCIDPSLEEANRKYSFRMECRLKSTNRGKMNKLEMISLATEHRQTLETEPVPIKPTKPFFFSKVVNYAADDLQ